MILLLILLKLALILYTHLVQYCLRFYRPLYINVVGYTNLLCIQLCVNKLHFTQNFVENRFI